MKRSHRILYIKAQVERAVSIVASKTSPVCVDAYRLFDKSCEIAGLQHTHGPDDSANLVAMFSQGIIDGCNEHDITVVKVPASLIAAVGHGRQAEYTEENTPSIIGNASVAKRTQPVVGYALCGKDCDKNHTILTNNRAKRIAPILTSATNMISETETMVGRDQLEVGAMDAVVSSLGVVYEIAKDAALNSRGNGRNQEYLED